MNGKPPVVRARFKAARAGAGANAVIAISSVALFELCYGVTKSVQRTENAERLARFVAGSIDVVAFEGDDAEV